LKFLVNSHVVNYQKPVTRWANILSFVISVLTIFAIIAYNGFYINDIVKTVIQGMIYASFVFYILKYFTLLFYSLQRGKYLHDTFFEFVVIFLLLLHFVSIFITPINIKIFNHELFEKYYLIFVQLFFLVVVSVELSKANVLLIKFNVTPPKFMLFAFLLLILAGTFLLMLPRMTVGHVSFIDALFTATSASCVTGLTTVDIGTVFTFKGQVIILALIQLGGISILTFATFFTIIFSKNAAGLRYKHWVQDLLSVNRMSDSYSLLKNIIFTSLLIEILGTGLLYIYWTGTHAFHTWHDTLFYSIFHTITAFNNAGMSLWCNNLENATIVYSYFPQTVIMLMVILGGIGFMTLSELFNPAIVRERRARPWRRLTPGTQIVLLTTFYIMLIGTLIFLFAEYNHSLAGKPRFFDKFFAALFQVSAARTAGFNTLNINHLGVPGMLLFMIIMFIGASPGSTGGGIKTTTFFVLVKSVLATVSGKQNIEFRKKFIPFDIVDKAYSIAFMSLGLILLSTFVLSMVEPYFSLITILFETLSAFTTTGLSTGSIAHFGWAGKFILILNMYIGRVGTLTMAFALSKRVKETKHQYPYTYFMVG
jgi:Trk-type K+ transport system membrane component